MDPYCVQIDPAAVRDMKGLADKKTKQRVISAIESLIPNPRCEGVEKLTGSDSLYRVRVGNYRVIFSIDDEHRLIAIRRVNHRSMVYRQL